jgi:hypothetical protein
MGMVKWEKWCRTSPVLRSTPCPSRVSPRPLCVDQRMRGPVKPRFLHFLLHGYRPLSRVWAATSATPMRCRHQDEGGTSFPAPHKGGRKANFPSELPAAVSASRSAHDAVHRLNSLSAPCDGTHGRHPAITVTPGAASPLAEALLQSAHPV